MCLPLAQRASAVVVVHPPVTGQRQTLTIVLVDFFDSQRSNVPVDFFEFSSTEFPACSKPPRRANHRKASYPRTQSYDQGGG